MTVLGHTGHSFAGVEERIFRIEEGLLRLQLSAKERPEVPVRVARPRPFGIWPLAVMLAAFGSAAVFGPLLLLKS